MAQSTADKKAPIQWQLKSPKHVRGSLARLWRLRHSGAIDSNMCRDFVSIARAMIEHDRFIHDCSINKRLELLEQLVRGEGNTLIEASELNNPLISDLRRKLAAAEKTNNELNSDLLSVKQKANELEAEMELLKENGQEET